MPLWPLDEQLVNSMHSSVPGPVVINKFLRFFGTDLSIPWSVRKLFAGRLLYCSGGCPGPDSQDLVRFGCQRLRHELYLLVGAGPKVDSTYRLEEMVPLIYWTGLPVAAELPDMVRNDNGYLIVTPSLTNEVTLRLTNACHKYVQ